ncbi:hypothetical protein [Luteolibacter luteus]|uniref:Uncharacterized protein n=1 Tax=Luteolibacter luteus TaxID=2728835 RepID=A0A858RHB6_9BACT|nr:hypothetical protein [Luteolibacter luteus]QJE95971.1 hypothetical protein HHL09_09315 [Luteolibacter luteus]
MVRHVAKNVIPSIKTGATWQGRQHQAKLNGVPIDITGATILMQLRSSVTSGVTAEWSTADGTIVPTVPGDGWFQILGRDVTWPAGSYVHDVLVVLASGRKIQFPTGEWTINPNVSRL